MTLPRRTPSGSTMRGRGSSSDHGDQQEQRDVGERGQVAHIGEACVDPGDRGLESESSTRDSAADNTEERRVDDGEPIRPAEQPSSFAH